MNVMVLVRIRMKVMIWVRVRMKVMVLVSVRVKVMITRLNIRAYNMVVCIQYNTIIQLRHPPTIVEITGLLYG